MSSERDAMAAALDALLPSASLRVPHKVIIVDQDGATVGVKLSGNAAPSATAKPVPVWFGLPGFTAIFESNAVGGMSFFGGSEAGAVASMYPAFVGGNLPVQSLAFGGGTKPVARKNDTVSLGSIRLTNTPPVGGVPTGFLVERILADGTTVPLGTIAGPIAVAPTPLTIPLDGVITSGREELLA